MFHPLLYLVYLPLQLLCTLLTWILSPILAIPQLKEKLDPSAVTKYPPSDFTSGPKLRDFLIREVRWFQTYDNPLDEWWYTDKYGTNSWLKSKFNQSDYDSKWYVSYVARVYWICRNPAYGFAFFPFGYSYDNGTKLIAVRDRDFLWKTGINNYSYWVSKNSKGQIAFSFQSQLFYYKGRCLEIILGWDLNKTEYKPRRMLKFRFNPIKDHSGYSNGN